MPSSQTGQYVSPPAASVAVVDSAAGEPARTAARGLGIAIFLVWLLSLACYSPGGRAGPLELAQLDWIAVGKVAVRVLAVLLLVVVLAGVPALPVRRRIFRCLLPFAVYASWAALSTLWSPLKAVSLGHAAELFMLLMLSALIGLVCVDDENLSRLMLHLALAMFLVSVLSVTMSYLGRGGGADRAYGFVHPNLAAQSAGGALLIVLAGSLLWGWRWAQKLTLPALVIAAFVLYVAHSRTAIAVTLLGVAGCLFIGGRKQLLLTLVVMCTLAVAFYLALDPHWTLLGGASEEAVTYALRGQTREQFASASGRYEMWAIGIDSLLKSPLIGHGNWMMTPSGMAFVWGEYQWQTLHNLFLHVLAGTGVIGGALFLWAVARPLNLLRRWLPEREAPQWNIAAFALLVFLWFLAVGLYELSFLGPVTPVSLFYFTTLGVMSGRL